MAEPLGPASALDSKGVHRAAPEWPLYHNAITLNQSIIVT